MKRHHLTSSLLTLTLIGWSLSAVVPPLADAQHGQETDMPVDEVHAGMRAVGLTVFHGTRIDSFPLEILGVLRDFSPGGDIILARAEGDSLKRSGIVQGMSGSPIYIDGTYVSGRS